MLAAFLVSVMAAKGHSEGAESPDYRPASGGGGRKWLVHKKRARNETSVRPRPTHFLSVRIDNPLIWEKVGQARGFESFGDRVEWEKNRLSCLLWKWAVDCWRSSVSTLFRRRFQAIGIIRTTFDARCHKLMKAPSMALFSLVLVVEVSWTHSVTTAWPRRNGNSFCYRSPGDALA